MNSVLSCIIGFVLIIGTVISYGIQYYKIIIKQSVNGINIYTIAMGCLGSCCTMYACILSNLSTMKSFDIGLDVSQFILICICYYVYIVIYMFYVRHANNITFSFYSDLHETQLQDKNYRSVFILFCISWIILIILGTASIIVPSSKGLINTMYVAATITGVIQWIPQLIETYISPLLSSLSLITLGLNIGGCILTMIYQSVINGQSYLLVLPYLLGALLQTIILVILTTRIRRNDQPLLQFSDEFDNEGLSIL